MENDEIIAIADRISDKLMVIVKKHLKGEELESPDYRQLKERCDKITKEHSDLNLALAAMLNGYQNLSQRQKDWFTVPKDLIDCYTKMVLEYDTNNPH